MNVGERIQIIMKKRGYSQNKLASRAQISQSGLSSIINGSVSPKEVTLKAIAKVLDCSVAELVGEQSSQFIQLNGSSVPIIGEIACGTPITAQENVEGYAQLPDGIHADFALKCRGNSMEPTFFEGDIVLIRQQPEVEDGQIAAVMIDDEATLKRFYRHEDGVLLVADNHKFPPLTIKNENISEMIVCGLAVGYVRMF